MHDLIPVSKIANFDNEPRILDLDLAKRLGMLDPHKIRALVVSARDELEMHGSLQVASANAFVSGFSASQAENHTELKRGRGRPGKAYWLNEGQALVICALSRTSTAAIVRKALIDVFQAYRAGKVVDVRAHRRSKPEGFPRELRSRDFSRVAGKIDELLEGTDLPIALRDILTFQSLAIERLTAQLS